MFDWATLPKGWWLIKTNIIEYQELLDWLFSRFPNYQQQGKVAYKADLQNTWALMEYLDHPERRFRSVHIAGTNGKGSSAHMLASILQEAGYKTGLYTSPHLIDFRERIKIDGQMIDKSEVLDFFVHNRSFFEQRQLSFFEMTVGLAFHHFARQKVDIAIIEVGLGGRLDSTNVIMPSVAAITNIGLDHTNILGSTKTAIAKEKAGIIKEGIPVVIGEEDPELLDLFRTIASGREAPMMEPDREQALYPMDLQGAYQAKNQQLVRAVVAQLNLQEFDIDPESIERGLNAVVKHTGLWGRWHQLGTQPLVICDTAHNASGLSHVVDQLSHLHYDKLHMVVGMVSDKDIDALLALLPKQATYYFVEPDIRRAFPASSLKDSAAGLHLVGEQYSSVWEGYLAALRDAGTKDVVFVGGSTFVVAQVLAGLASRND